MKHIFKILFTSGLISMLTACGGSGDSKPPAVEYSGKTTVATITDTNSKTLSNSSTEASAASTSSDSFSAFKLGSSSQFDADSFVKKTAETAANYATQDVPGVCSSGSVSISGLDANTDPNGYLDYTINYNNCTVADTTGFITVDGTARFTGYVYGDFTIVYSNFTITQAGDSQTINMTISCNSVGCTFNTDFKGSDGRIYRMQDFVVSGDNYIGYTISGRVYDPDHGYVDIDTVQSIYFTCSNGRPASGTITFTDGSTTATVEYLSCSQYRVTFNGTPTTYNW